MATINLKNLEKFYGKNKVIHGLSADIKDGEFVVLVGPSGCGKSTLLRMIAGLEEVNSGEVLIDGKKVNDLEPMERNIAMVFQNYALYPHMSVYDNMAYGLKIAKIPKNEIDDRVQKAANILKINDFLDRKPSQLSGGQRQRVAMGRAIVRSPVAFLYDEPLSNLDAALRVQMRLEIKKLHTQLKTTSVFVTHDQIEAMTLGDRLVVMDLGKVMQVGTPIEVYSKPKNLFTAQFIGSPAMNIFQCESDGSQIKFVNGNQINLSSKKKGSIAFGIRPEDLKISKEGNLNAHVDMLEMIGSDTLVHANLENSDQSLVISVPGVLNKKDIGDKIKLSFDSTKVHLFDRETGERIN